MMVILGGGCSRRRRTIAGEILCPDKFEKPYFEELSLRIRSEAEHGNVLPEPQSIFRAFGLVSVDGVKVVMLAQDPYPDKDVF
ncbi:MAG TPA: hypothetical protein DCO86_04535 [Spirochaetaceae bacterium]|nr:hypothetical protein [Spirochaetaceae bacterium]